MKYSWNFVFIMALLSSVSAVVIFPQTQGDRSKSKAENAPPAIKLTLKAVHDTVQTDSPIEVEVIVTNVSGQVFTYVKQAVADPGGFDYKFDVRNEKGSTPPDTRFRRALKGREDTDYLTPETPLQGSLVYRELQPDQTLTNTVNVSRLYDFKEPGKYTIRAKAFDNKSKTFVGSNSITVTVTK